MILDYSKYYDNLLRLYLIGSIILTFTSNTSFFTLLRGLLFLGGFSILVLIFKMYKAKIVAEQVEKLADFYFKIRCCLTLLQYFNSFFMSDNGDELYCYHIFPYFLISVFFNLSCFIDFISSIKFLGVETVILLSLFGNYDMFILFRIVRIHLLIVDY